MATGRIGTTPVLRTRWSKEPAGGTTSLSGLDDYSVSLVYEVGYEAVYQNGALLSRGNDYTATNGTTITLTNATVAGDIIEVFANNVVPLTDTYSQSVADGKFVNNTIVDAKGDLIVGSAADTFVRLPVGSANQVLTVDSATTSGLKWAAPTGGSWSAWTPAARSGFTVGNGTETARYNENNGIVFFFYKFVLGSTSSVSAQMGVQLPSTPATAYSLTFFQGNIRDDGSNNIDAVVQINGSDIQWNVFSNSLTYGDRTSPSGSIPMVWTTGDFFSATGFYEKA